MIKIGKFVFGDSVLVLDEFDLISLMKLLEKRNKRLYKKFVRFYQSIMTEENREFLRTLFGEKT